MDLFNFGLTEQPSRRRVDRKLLSRRPIAIPADRDIYEERDFLQVLYLERRRSERSSRPLCLVLLEGVGIPEVNAREMAFQQILKILGSSVRETDTVGWYKQKCTVGVLFSDINSADSLVVNTLRTKVSNVITVILGPDLANRIQISVHVFPNSNDLSTNPSDLILYPELPHQSQSRKTARLLKRVIDVVGALVLLCLLAPILVLIALVIKLSSKGPVIFRQARVGRYGKLFSFWKFRTMHVDSDTGTVYKITNDPRITPVGRFLRKTSLDELPQLWNVLRGEMSLVGPRPPLPYELDCYALWHRRRVLEVKPGITGLWQVTGRSRTNFNDMVRLDLRYVQQWSIWLDIKIILQTPKAVFDGEGAY
ncbi:MAG: glycosyl transferase [Acidobacteria bacterium]|nr:MAG: glycosyl transferase [Acidobacteriota bacterium]